MILSEPAEGQWWLHVVNRAKTLITIATYRIHAQYERRVSFHHGRCVFYDITQSIHVQIEDHGHEYRTDREYRYPSQVYSCKNKYTNIDAVERWNHIVTNNSRNIIVINVRLHALREIRIIPWEYYENTVRPLWIHSKVYNYITRRERFSVYAVYTDVENIINALDYK